MADYRRAAAAARCEPVVRTGQAGVTDTESTAHGIRYSVRTPANYDATIAHPLLMVYAPAGQNRFASERLTSLTYDATSAGFVVAYADSRRLSIPTIIELGTIPGLISKKWCIDEKRVYLTGHSDGGTVASALAFLEQTAPMPAAIAPSAAGINGADLAPYKCPAPISVMVMHSANDHLFPGFGVQAAAWWAVCNGCDPAPTPIDNGCVAYPHCTRGVMTWYCEGTGSHTTWLALNQAILHFFSSYRP
jgi:polyhydroxybutyrate depolymerase